MRGARPSLTISVADYFQNYQHGQKFINGGIASHAISCPFMFVLFPSSSTNHETTGTKVMPE